MNQEISQNASWGRTEILARADRLAERIITTWPGPNPTPIDAATSAVWTSLGQVLAVIPSGAWTTYGDVAAVIGTHPVPLGQRLANHPAVNAHRVLGVGGVVASNFRWLDETRTETAREVLEQEGVEFDETGRANPAQRLSAQELVTLAGLDAEAVDPTSDAEHSSDDRAARFFELLDANQPAATASGARVMLDAWVHLGGSLHFGRNEETSCFLMAEYMNRRLWPFTVYPSGKVEVVFQYMATRPPFDDLDLRHQFRDRLDAIAGIDLPASKIELRPGFPIELLADAPTRDAVIQELAWFIDKVFEPSLTASE